MTTNCQHLKNDQHFTKKKFHFSAYYEKRQMQLVLLIIMESTNLFSLKRRVSYVDFGGKNQRFSGRAGQHYLK